MFFSTTWMQIPGPAVHWIHRYAFSTLLELTISWIVPLVIPAPYIALYVLARSDPGIITPQNVANHLKVFPYDRVIFVPDTICRSCKFVKPARSKHCNVCKVCVARHDHHCCSSCDETDIGIWIGNCVGYSNTHLFVLFIFVNTALLSYSTYLHWLIFSHKVARIRTLQRQTIASLGHALANVRLRSKYQLYLSVVLEGQMSGALFLICSMISVLTMAFLLHHLWLLSTGTTTNESFKWADIKEGLQTKEICILDADDPYMYSLVNKSDEG
jgi:palmitoyltransferase ZDHHC4